MHISSPIRTNCSLYIRDCVLSIPDETLCVRCTIPRFSPVCPVRDLVIRNCRKPSIEWGNVEKVRGILTQAYVNNLVVENSHVYLTQSTITGYARLLSGAVVVAIDENVKIGRVLTFADGAYFPYEKSSRTQNNSG